MGIVFVSMYALFVGLATLFLKSALNRNLEVYKLFILSGASMVVVGIIATIIAHQSFNVSFTKEELKAGVIYGLLHAIGSLGFFIGVSRMDVGIATALAMLYVVVTAVAAWLFLGETMNWIRILAIALVLSGAVILALQRSH